MAGQALITTTATASPLLQLPAAVRTKIFTFALQVDFIQYYWRHDPEPVRIGTYGHDKLDYLPWYKAREPPFQISDPGEGHSRFRPLSTLLPLSSMCRQINNEVKTLMAEINVFYVSLQDLPHFVKPDVVTAQVLGAIKTVGILNNAHLADNTDNFVELNRFTALEKIVIVPRGGPRDEEYKDTIKEALVDAVLMNTVIVWEPFASERA